MIYYRLKQLQNSITTANGKWFAYPVTGEQFDLDKLAEHMSNHNSPYSRGMIKGILGDMVACIKELLLDGKSVYIDDLASFSVGIRHAEGAETFDDFSVTKNVKGVRMRARAVGELSSTNLNLDASLKHSSLDTEAAGASSSTAGGDSVSGDKDNSGQTTTGGSTDNGGNKLDDDDML